MMRSLLSRMKFSPQVLLGIVASTTAFKLGSLESNESIFSVSPIDAEDGEQYFLDCKNKNGDIPAGDKSEVTDKICSTIFKSSLFRDVHKVHTVGQEGNKCLAKKYNERDSKTLEYCISPEYVLDTVGRRGRFVILDETVIAIAEQPATVSGYKGDLASLGNDDGNAICNLTVFNRFRLCSTVLNAGKYRSDVSFQPGTEPACAKKKIFSHESKETIRFSVSKWAIKCSAAPIRKRASETYYISKTVGSSSRFMVSEEIERNTVVLKSLADVNLYLTEQT